MPKIGSFRLSTNLDTGMVPGGLNNHKAASLSLSFPDKTTDLGKSTPAPQRETIVPTEMFTKI